MSKTIIGIGTLMCLNSAKKTCPDLKSFRTGVIDGYIRIFNKIDPTLSDFTGNKIANNSAVKDENGKLLVSVFEISDSEYRSLIIREFEYNMHKVSYIDENNIEGYGIICGSYKNYKECLLDISKCPDRLSAYNSFTKKYKKNIWSDEFMPNPDYIRICLIAASTLGQEFIDNYLDNSYIADKTLTLRQLCNSNDTDYKSLGYGG